MMDGTDADGEWSDDDGVKSGSATALSDNEPDERTTALKITTTITTSPSSHKRDPVHAILDKIDAELGAIAAANNITTFSQPQSIKKSTFPSFDRSKLEAQGVVFDTGDEIDHKGRSVFGHTRGGSSDRDTGVGTGSVHDDIGSEHKRIVGSAQIHSDVADLTDVQTDDGRKGDEGHSDLDSVAAQQIDEKFKEIMRKKRGGYLEDLKARIPRPGSDRDTVNSEEGVVSRQKDPIPVIRNHRSRSSGPLGKPPRPTLMPRNCLTPPSSPRRGPGDLPPHPRQTYVSSPTLKHTRHTPQPYTGYASDLDSVKTEDFESRFQDLIIGPHSKDPSSKLKNVSKKLANPESNSQVQSKMSLDSKSSYPKPAMEPKSFNSSSFYSSFQNRPTGDVALRISPYNSSLPNSESRSTKDIMKLPRPRSVSPARLSSWVEHGKHRNTGLFSWDDDFWKTNPPAKRSASSASTFEEVESLCHSNSSSSVDSQNVRKFSGHSPSLSRSFTRQNSTTSTSTGASSGHLADREFASYGNRSQSISSVGSAVDDAESFDFPHQLSDSHYMERIFQRVLDWKTGEPTNESWKYENWNTAQLRSSGLLDLTGSVQKKGRKKVLIIPDEEEEEDFPFAKMKFNHKPDFSMDSPELNIPKKTRISGSSSASMRSSNRDSSLSQQSERSFPASQTSVSSYSTDVSSWQEAFKTGYQHNQESIAAVHNESRPSLGSRSVSVDNQGTYPSGASMDYYAPFNPFLPVHAERMLMNLGFSGTDSLLPERFLRDWYQKMAKAQLEVQQLCQQSDGQESVSDSIPHSHAPSGRSTPNRGYMYPDQLVPFPSGRYLQRSATVSSYQYPEGYNATVRASHKAPERENHERSSENQSTNNGDNGSARRRRQWTSSRQKSLPLFLETLNEEDENRCKKTSVDRYSKLKAFLAEEMSMPSSESSQELSNIDSGSDTNSSKSEKINTKNNSVSPGLGSSKENQHTAVSEKLPFADNKIQRIPEIKHELPPSKDSLEVADIMLNQSERKQKRSLLEPAMVSIVLEDVDGNIVSSKSSSSSSHLGSDLSEDHLHIPLSRSSSSSISPIPLSPVTVIEVGLDNQQDSMDTDEGTSASTSNKESFDSEPSKSETRSLRVSSLVSDTTAGSTTTQKRLLESSLHLQEFETLNEDTQNCVSVEADDGRLSPISKFLPVEQFQEWLDEGNMDDYYIAHDQSIQCCIDGGDLVLQTIQHKLTNINETNSHADKIEKILNNKETQMSVLLSSSATQTGTDSLDNGDDVECKMYQKVVTNGVACSTLDHAEEPKEELVQLKYFSSKTVGTISPQNYLEEVFSPSEERRHSITDDWVISNFKNEAKECPIINDNDLQKSKMVHDDSVQKMFFDFKLRSGFPNKRMNSMTNSLSDQNKFNEDGSPMTKLDVFATDFLTEAEDYCSYLQSLSDSEDKRRRNSLLSSTLSNDSWGTQNTVIFNARNPKVLSPATEESELFQQEQINEPDLLNTMNSSLDMSKDTSESLDITNESQNLTSFPDSDMKIEVDVSHGYGIRHISSQSMDSIESLSWQRHPERCYSHIKAHSVDTVSGHTRLRRVPALSLPLKSHSVLSWSMFSTSLSSESSDVSGYQVPDKGGIREISDSEFSCLPLKNVRYQALPDSDDSVEPTKLLPCGAKDDNESLNISDQTICESATNVGKSLNEQLQESKSSRSLSCDEQDEDEVRQHAPKTELLNYFRDFLVNTVSDAFADVAENDSNSKINRSSCDFLETKSHELVPSDAESCHLTSEQENSHTFQSTNTWAAKGNHSNYWTVADDLDSKDTESGYPETFGKVTAKRKFLSQFMIHNYSPNTNEPDKEDTENLPSRNERLKPGSGLNSGSSLVKQMTTIYESDSDNSDSENYGKDGTSSKTKSPELTKSRTWNGNHTGSKMQISVKSHSLSSQGGDFAKLARKAFIEMRTSRVTSPFDLSDGVVSDGLVDEESKTVHTLNSNTQLCRTYSKEGPEKDLQNVSQKRNHSPSVTDMFGYENFINKVEEDERDSPADQLLHQRGHNVSSVNSNPVYVSSKRLTITPSPRLEQDQIKNDIEIVCKTHRPKSETGPELNEENSFKPIPHELDVFPTSCSSSPGRNTCDCSNEVPSVTICEDEGKVTWTRSQTKHKKLKGSLICKTSLSRKGSVSTVTPLSSMDTNSYETPDVMLSTLSQSLSSSLETSPSSPEIPAIHQQKDSVFHSLCPSDHRRLAGKSVCVSPKPRKGTLLSQRSISVSPSGERQNGSGNTDSPRDFSAGTSCESEGLDCEPNGKTVCKSPSDSHKEIVNDVSAEDSDLLKKMIDERSEVNFHSNSKPGFYDNKSKVQTCKDIRNDINLSAFTEFQAEKSEKQSPKSESDSLEQKEWPKQEDMDEVAGSDNQKDLNMNKDLDSGSGFKSLKMLGDEQVNISILHQRPKSEDMSSRYSPKENQVLSKEEVSDPTTQQYFPSENKMEFLPINFQHSLKNKTANISDRASPNRLSPAQYGFKRAHSPKLLPPRKYPVSTLNSNSTLMDDSGSDKSQNFVGASFQAGKKENNLIFTRNRAGLDQHSNTTPVEDLGSATSQNLVAGSFQDGNLENNLIFARDVSGSDNHSKSTPLRVVRSVEIRVKPLDNPYRFEDLTVNSVSRENLPMETPSLDVGSQVVFKDKQKFQSRQGQVESKNENPRSQNRKRSKISVFDIKSMFESKTLDSDTKTVPSTNSRKVVHTSIKNLVSMFEDS